MANVYTIFLVIEQRIGDTFEEHCESNTGNTNRQKQKIYCMAAKNENAGFVLCKRILVKSQSIFITSHKRTKLFIHFGFEKTWSERFLCNIRLCLISALQLP